MDKKNPKTFETLSLISIGVVSVTYFGAFDADDSVEGSCRIVEEGHVDGRRRGRDPRTFRLWIDVEHMSLARKNWLFPKNETKETIKLQKSN